MKCFFINGFNAKAGGGKSILNNYLTLLRLSNSKAKYYVLTPNQEEYLKYSSDFIEIISVNKLYRLNILFPFVNALLITKLLIRYKVDALFNLADVPVPTSIPQVFLFDWSYAVYPDSIVWKMMDLKSLFIRKLKLFYFKKYLKHVSIMIAQSETMKTRLNRLYGLTGIEVVPNAVSLENLEKLVDFDFDLPKGMRLLYLTHYYPHKNIEIFIPLAKEIKKRGLNYKLITTIDEKQHPKARLFLKKVNLYDLQEIIINIGSVNMEKVPSLYKQCDALLMPTLLESFSGTYVEAMYHKKIILTSDMDFAIDVCGDAAFYFDPLDENSILNAINLSTKDTALCSRKIGAGSNQLKKLLNWEQAFKCYQEIMEKTMVLS